MEEWKLFEGNEIMTAQDLIDQVNALIDEMMGMDNDRPG
jgi:hypothetical protein